MTFGNQRFRVPTNNKRRGKLVIPLSDSGRKDELMGRGILLWLLGVPIPIIILLALLWH